MDHTFVLTIFSLLQYGIHFLAKELKGAPLHTQKLSAL